MAFEYFRDQQVDYAVIEVGLGGRLDSTNIITPILSIITNISLDHTQFLGDTEEKIAAEKAGIIKKGVPALLGEAENNRFTTFQKQGGRSWRTFLLRPTNGHGKRRVQADGRWQMVLPFR